MFCKFYLMREYNQLLVNIDSPLYPDLLKHISKPPKELFIKGKFREDGLDEDNMPVNSIVNQEDQNSMSNDDMKKRISSFFIPEIFHLCLSVVGSRKMTPYGKRVTHRFIRNLASKGITIVSGFMYGIDAEAHRAALSVGGRTIAVMPCGIDLVCPSFQEDLYYEILDSGGLVISEYAKDTPAKKWTFPQRNRIVAGLSQALFVVEAGVKSGTLITAKHARKIGREIFTAPGDVFSANFKGINQLINQGARIACSPCDIEEYYRDSDSENLILKSYVTTGGTNILGGEKGKLDFQTSPASQKALFSEEQLDLKERKIFSALEIRPLSIDELVQQLDFSTAELVAKLTSLSLRGLVVEEGDKYYVS